MRKPTKDHEHTIEAKRARLRRFLSDVECVQQEADTLSQEELAARLNELKQAAYENFLSQAEGEKPRRAGKG